MVYMKNITKTVSWVLKETTKTENKMVYMKFMMKTVKE